MKKMLIAIILLISGCGILQDATSGDGGGFLPDGSLDKTDIRNWDFSPCFEDASSFGVCFDLLWSNKDLILDGEQAIFDAMQK